MNQPLPKRLIEVDLPIARISAHARREKSIRHGHISTLHIWWARRPLAACRAVICAALWPDPADPHCPPAFRAAAAKHLVAFSKRMFPVGISAEGHQLQATASPESRKRWEVFTKNDPPLNPTDDAHQNVLRFALLDFIADFANWDNSTVAAYLDTSRALTQAAHEALGGEPGTRPLVVDPFAGGGSIPLEALRVGADAFASDLNPVAVLLNKVVLEYIPKYGQKLADEVRKWGQWVKEQAEKELAAFYPKDADGATPIAYLWARTIRCEGPGCGAEVPLMRSLWLAKKEKKSVALKIVPRRAGQAPAGRQAGVDFEIIKDAKAKDVGEGTVKRGSATCPCCGHTTPLKSVREQLRKRHGGAADARLFCVVTTKPNVQGRYYRLPCDLDSQAVKDAENEVSRLQDTHDGLFTYFPCESTPQGGGIGAGRGLSHTAYAMDRMDHMHTPRQLLALATLAKAIRRSSIAGANDLVVTLAGLALGRTQDLCGSLSTWANTLEAVCGSNRAQNRMPIVWDFVESVPVGGAGGDYEGQADWVARVVDTCQSSLRACGTVARCKAQQHALPDNSASAVITDPPYYDAFAYSDLSDFFLAWIKRVVPQTVLIYDAESAPKEHEIVMYGKGTPGFREKYDEAYYEQQMTIAFSEAKRISLPNAVSVVVFANKSTEGWEAVLNSLISGGWTITASWPIDTERPVRQRAQESAALASSIHLVCRPRSGNEIGDWRDVLGELPTRMHEWMPRLASEGVVGADAIFACLGPALEIFSRYAKVEKSNGDPVTLKEYLEHVWAAVSKEALSTIFRNAEASGLEPDARLTAMWLWTVGGGKPTPASESTEDEEEAEDDTAEDEEDEKPKASKVAGFTLEFDAARKIAQGLGIHLEKSQSVVEVKGDKARLLAVAERTPYLFGKETTAPAKKAEKKKKPKQPSLFDALDAAEKAEEGGWTEVKGPKPGTTALDKVHQAMILFGAQRGELLKRFLVDDGVGKDARFWTLAQSLAALYPPGTDERRWVEGVLARKKGLGL